MAGAPETTALTPAEQQLAAEAERAEELRDMRSQLAELEREDEREIIFRENSPARRKIIVYNMKTGEPVAIPRYMRDTVLAKPHPDGGFMFTAVQSKAPPYVQGTIKCFLHADSPERATGVLDKIGLAGITCPAGKLSSVHSKRMHGLHKHNDEWTAYQAFLSDQAEAAAVERQEKQLDAMLRLAERGDRPAPAPAATEPTVLECTQCGAWETRPDSKNPQASLDTHKRMHCIAREGADAGSS